MIIEALNWQNVTITQIRDESSGAKTFRIQTETAYSFVAGQHLIARITLQNGFTAVRDYSFSSAPSSGVIEITVGRAIGGEVSQWFHEVCKLGDTIEITPAFGTHFTWNSTMKTSTVLIGGGTGITPLMSIFREHRDQKATSPMKLLYSARNFDEICFKDELLDTKDAHCILTRPSADWQGLSGRVSIDRLTPYVSSTNHFYICGPYTFVADIKKMLLSELLVPSSSIKVEQFD